MIKDEGPAEGRSAKNGLGGRYKPECGPRAANRLRALFVSVCMLWYGRVTVQWGRVDSALGYPF